MSCGETCLLFPQRRQQKALNPELIFAINNKQAESLLITEHIRVLALQTVPGGRAGPEHKSYHSRAKALLNLARLREN